MQQAKLFCKRCNQETAQFREEWNPSRPNSQGRTPGLEVVPMVIYSLLFGPLYDGWRCRKCQSRSIKETSKREWEKNKAERKKKRDAAGKAS